MVQPVDVGIKQVAVVMAERGDGWTMSVNFVKVGE